MLRETKFIDGQPRHDGGQPCFYVLNGCLIRLFQTQKSFLDNIFAFNQTPEIALSERQKTLALSG